MTRLARISLIAFSTLALAQTSADPWTPADIVQPAVLAQVVATPKSPIVISVAFPALYRSKHILHARDAKAGSTPEGMEALRNLVANTPKGADIVIYCGCCPMVKCPNVRPAFRTLKEMGYTRVRVLDIPTNMHTDWYSKDYPSEK